MNNFNKKHNDDITEKISAMEIKELVDASIDEENKTRGRERKITKNILGGINIKKKIFGGNNSQREGIQETIRTYMNSIKEKE